MEGAKTIGISDTQFRLVVEALGREETDGSPLSRALERGRWSSAGRSRQHTSSFIPAKQGKSPSPNKSVQARNTGPSGNDRSKSRLVRDIYPGASFPRRGLLSLNPRHRRDCVSLNPQLRARQRGVTRAARALTGGRAQDWCCLSYTNSYRSRLSLPVNKRGSTSTRQASMNQHLWFRTE